jgi:hypothetical protein
VNLDNYPALKDVLFTHAYTTFFTHTMANFEAVYEGRDVRIGRARQPQSGEPGSEHEETSPSARIAALLTQAQDFIQRNIPSSKESIITRLFTAYNPQAEFIDEDGFAHFKRNSDSTKQPNYNQQVEPELQAMWSSSKSAAQGFWKDLYDAIQKDTGVR